MRPEILDALTGMANLQMETSHFRDMHCLEELSADFREDCNATAYTISDLLSGYTVHTDHAP